MADIREKRDQQLIDDIASQSDNSDIDNKVYMASPMNFNSAINNFEDESEDMDGDLEES